MNTKSIRFRIVMWYSIIIFFTTVFIFVVFYAVTRQTLYTQVDRELFSHASKLTDIITRQGVNIHETMLKQQLFDEFAQMPGMLVVLLDEQGKVMKSSFLEVQEQSYSSLYQEVRESKIPIFRDLSLNNFPMRFTAWPITYNKSFGGVVIIGHPIDVIQKSLFSLSTTLFIVFSFLIFPIILGGYIVAGKVMEPLSGISKQIESISLQRLGERVASPGTGDEIENLAQTFNKLLDRLQDAFKRERQFIGDVAHELKTPLSTIGSAIELATTRERTGKEYRATCEDLLIDVNKLSSIVKNILDLAWFGAENEKLDKRRFNLSLTVKELHELAVRMGDTKHMKIFGEIKHDIFITGVEDKISRALLNIIDNAIKYTPDKGKVNLRLFTTDDHAVFEVNDTGVGIVKKDIPHIFERFWRGREARETHGTGLGLAIAQGIIKAHGGEIRVESTVGKGTSIRILLPLFRSVS
ncbi:MAG TPA: ATP-binding protein [Patescibacteria group bacterium]|nr:ATP-binding protein [Patescibacteria group bacterium]